MVEFILISSHNGVPPQIAVPLMQHHHSGIWQIYYEDETMEDCGIAQMSGEPNYQNCTDTWFPTNWYFFTQGDCQAFVSVLYSKYGPLYDELTCYSSPPPPSNDDSPLSHYIGNH